MVCCLVAGAFSLRRYLLGTSINASSGSNSGNSYTLLSVPNRADGDGLRALEGIIAPVALLIRTGVVVVNRRFATGALGVSSDFADTAARGAMLVTLLAMRYLRAERG